MKQFHDETDKAGLPPEDEAHVTARLAIETGARVMRLARRALRRSPTEILSLSQLRTLAYVRDSPGACVGDVADQLFVGAPTASKVVDELVERGLVRREVDTVDRRRVLLGATDAGRELLSTVARPAQDELAELVAALPERDRASVREGLAVLRDLLARAMVVVLMLVGSPALASAQTRATAAPTDTVVLDLATVARIAAERSTAVELGALAEDAAEAQLREDRAVFLPRLDLDASHGRRTFNTASFGLEFPTAPGQQPFFDPSGEVVGPVTTIDARARVGLTLFDWSAVERVRSAETTVDAARTATEVARVRAAFGAADAYVQAVRAEGRLRARAADLEVARDLLDVARELLAAGVGVRLDVTRAEAQLATLQAELVAARSTADRARLGLLRALDLPLATPVRLLALTAGREGEAPPTVDAALSAALDRRRDLQEMDLRVEAARLDVEAVRAERLPRVTLGAAEGFTSKQYDALLDTYEWSLRVSVPVFDGMRNKARAQEEAIQLDALETRRSELAEQVEFEVRDALLRMASADELLAASAARLALAQAELDQAQERFEAGVASSADVFTAALRLTDARTADVDARAAYEGARVALAGAQGAVEELR